MALATITINIDPSINLGPLTIAWHGLMIAVGIAFGGWLAHRSARGHGLSGETLLNLVVLIALAGILGARVFYLVLNEPHSLVHPGDWLGNRGFAFYGALTLGTGAVALYIRHRQLTLRYLDALAAGFPLGLAVGRIGDVISGEHYGPATTLPWGFRYLNPHAEVPSSALAYHQGGFYELVLGLAILAIVWPLRDRFRRPTMLLWTVIALYAAGRFAMFFYRSDTAGFGFGINAAQAVSLLLLAVAGVSALLVRRHVALTLPQSQPERPGAERTASHGVAVE